MKSLKSHEKKDVLTLKSPGFPNGAEDQGSHEELNEAMLRPGPPR